MKCTFNPNNDLFLSPNPPPDDRLKKDSLYILQLNQHRRIHGLGKSRALTGERLIESPSVTRRSLLLPLLSPGRPHPLLHHHRRRDQRTIIKSDSLSFSPSFFSIALRSPPWLTVHPVSRFPLFCVLSPPVYIYSLSPVSISLSLQSVAQRTLNYIVLTSLGTPFLFPFTPSTAIFALDNVYYRSLFEPLLASLGRRRRNHLYHTSSSAWSLLTPHHRAEETNLPAEGNRDKIPGSPPLP